jgi:hypothetical protein
MLYCFIMCRIKIKFSYLILSYQSQYAKDHILMLLLTNFNRETQMLQQKAAFRKKQQVKNNNEIIILNT